MRARTRAEAMRASREERPSLQRGPGAWTRVGVPAGLLRGMAPAAASKRTPEGLPVHSLRTLLADLATLTLNEVALPEAPDHTFPLHARPTPVQQKAFDLLAVDPTRFVASSLTG